MHLPTPFHRLFHRVLSGVIEMRWSVALFLALVHALSTFIGFRMLGEVELAESATQFIYFYVVSGSTVGYGDFSPATGGGKLFTALWVIPGAISIFAFLLGKAVATTTLTLRIIMNGLGNFTDKTGHVVVIGHVPGQTELLLEEAGRLRGKTDIVVVSSEDISSLQTDWRFIRATSLSNRGDLARAGVKGAAFIVILGRDDDESLAASMAVGAMVPEGHVVAYFRETGPAEIVEAHCPEIETVTSISVQMVARALVDPGAGDVLQALASTRVGATLYSTLLDTPSSATVSALRTALGAAGASLVGIRVPGEQTPAMTLAPDEPVADGCQIYYIADHRIGDRFTLET